MTRQCTSNSFAACFIGVFMSAAVSADTVFFDNFSDGKADFPPVQWTPSPTTPGSFDASSGDYVLSPTPKSDPDINISSDALEFTLEDTSIRTQGKISAGGGFLGVAVRNQAAEEVVQYFGVIAHVSNLGGTVLALGRADGLESDSVFFGGFPTLPFDIRRDDGILQLDVIGNELKLWGWKAGEPMPDGPQLSAVDDTYASGFVRIIGGVDDTRASSTVFRYVHVADMHIPEPSTAVLACLGFVCMFSLRRWKTSASHLLVDSDTYAT